MFSVQHTTPIILLVDDIAENIYLLREAVKDLGVIYFATNGKDALEIARARKPDIVLLDIEMPGLNGYEVCRAIKDDPTTSDAAIIFVTAHDKETHELLALEHGGIDFLQKPLNIPVVRARVNTQLRLKRKTNLLALARRDLADLVRTLPAFIAYWDNELHNAFCNDTDGNWFGITANDMHNQTLLAIVGEENFSLISSYVKSVLTGTNESFDITLSGKNQRKIFGQVSLVHRENNHTTQGFLMLITDITDRKLAEMALYDEKERMRITLNSIGDAVIATDPQGIITFINPIAEDLTGWLANEALGQPIEMVMPLQDGSDKRPLQNPIRLAIKEQRIVGMSLDCVLICRYGKELEVEDSAAPIRNHEGLITGAIIVFHDVSEARAMAIKMTHLAQHDALTNLPNRILLRDRTEQALRKAQRNQTSVAMLLLDIDNFKMINDTYGHSIGDQLLQQVAQGLLYVLRTEDTLCRQGGDEFIVLLSDFTSIEQINDFASRLLKVFSKKWVIEDNAYELSASIGISLYPSDSNDMESLHRHADAAMYSAKQQGRNRFQFFSTDIENKLKIRHMLEKDLTDALSQKVFEVFYQPKIDAINHSIVGVEALLRWKKSNGEIILPGDFIPLAEETGLIIPLGKLVFTEACQQTQYWNNQGIPIKTAINVSAVQFEDSTFVMTVADILKKTNVNPQNIELEITESVLAKNIHQSLNIINQLKTLGVCIALDDFGTGYSSLSYLKNFPFDALKIDQSFVRDMLSDEADKTIIKAIIQMAKGLHLELVAEGVETQAHANFLIKLGCIVMQGFYYSKPVPVEQMDKLLRCGLLENKQAL